MNHINRNNYETFFLLYADEELTVAEKREVEQFLQANPDLQEELVMLQQSILKPDTIVFVDKKSLFKKEVLPGPIQEKLLLYLDNELSPAERNSIEDLLKEGGDVKKEWNILQQTKLQPVGEFIFPDKRSLYKQETGRLAAFPWWRLAVAAVFIGFGVWGGIAYFNNDNKISNREVAKNTPLEKSADINKPVFLPTKDSIVPDKVKEKIQVLAGVLPKKSVAETNTASSKKTASRVLPRGDMQTIAVKGKDNNLPTAYFDNVNNTGSNKTITPYVTPLKQDNDIVDPGNSDIVINPGKQDPAGVYASPVSLIENEADNENNGVLFMDEKKIKKTKFGGIIRKVKRVLERNANIKPGGNNIKVANLEFAIQ